MHFQLASVDLRTAFYHVHTRTDCQETFLDFFILQSLKAFVGGHSVLVCVTRFQVTHHNALSSSLSARTGAFGPLSPRHFNCKWKVINQYIRN